jgi:hypothetical protein
MISILDLTTYQKKNFHFSSPLTVAQIFLCRSAAWQYVPDAVKDALQQRRQDDGEFWMDVQDFVKTFDDCDICYLTPDSADVHSFILTSLQLFRFRKRKNPAGI